MENSNHGKCKIMSMLNFQTLHHGKKKSQKLRYTEDPTYVHPTKLEILTKVKLEYKHKVEFYKKRVNFYKNVEYNKEKLHSS